MGNDLIVLDRKARRELEQLLTDGNTAQKIAKRARIVLMTADGHGVVAIMREVGISKTTVWRWQDYFAEAGVDGLIKGRSKPPGRKPLSAAMKLKVVEKTVKERPANATHWSVRSMAEEIGISHTSVQRIWAEHGLKPHHVRSFKISNDPDFVAKVEDIVGLYVDPPEKALVLSVDEKSQIQALYKGPLVAIESVGCGERQFGLFNDGGWTATRRYTLLRYPASQRRVARTRELSSCLRGRPTRMRPAHRSLVESLSFRHMAGSGRKKLVHLRRRRPPLKFPSHP